MLYLNPEEAEARPRPGGDGLKKASGREAASPPGPRAEPGPTSCLSGKNAGGVQAGAACVRKTPQRRPTNRLFLHPMPVPGGHFSLSVSKAFYVDVKAKARQSRCTPIKTGRLQFKACPD